jgi:hypothetical protein
VGAFCFEPALYAFEVDNPSCHFQQMQDVSGALNAEVNRRIKTALDASYAQGAKPKEEVEVPEPLQKWYDEQKATVEKAHLNAEEKKKALEGLKKQFDFQMNGLVVPSLVGCDKTQVFEVLRAALASSWMGNMETWASDQNFSKCIMDAKKSVYKEFTYMESPMISMAGLNYVVQVGDTKIGVDKLSHFMTEGFDYYQKSKEGASLEEVLKLGEAEEDGGYGLTTTGVKSYADMMADYEGLQFWKQLIEGPHPYLACENGKWVPKRKFDWNEYVNPGFDESINCSDYKTKKMEEKVDKATSALVKEHGEGPPFTCPIDLEKCSAIKKYVTDPVAYQAIIHSRCKAVSEGGSASQGGSPHATH